MIEKDWHKCYGESWTGIIVPDAFSHPAKFSRALIRRIYQHLLEQGYIQRGSIVLDPFAGVGLGALHAMQNGLHWVGIELEEKFVGLGKQNITLWNDTYADQMPNWGSAVLLQGDSRELARVVGKAEVCVSSPPYSSSPVSRQTNNMFNFEDGKSARAKVGSKLESENYGTNPAQLANLPEGDIDTTISSPPFGQADRRSRYAVQDGDVGDCFTRSWSEESQGDSEGQLGAMPEGEFSAAVSSPPYSGSDPSASHVQGHSRLDPNSPNYRPFAVRSIEGGYNEAREYGNGEGQLGQMPEGEFSAAVSSPPFAQTIEKRSGPSGLKGGTFKLGRGDMQANREGYGRSEGQLGGESGDTFWSAAHTIMQQCYQVLKPGAVAVWVLKAFVRNKQIVNFPEQWKQLGEACGFKTIEWIRAWLVEDRGTQIDLFGNYHHHMVERKSFFRRLSERKARAAKFWPSVSRNDKAQHLMTSRYELWKDYRERLEEPDEMHPPIYPTKNRIISRAQMIAYVEAGEPDIDIDTSIDFEVVLVQRKLRGIK